MKNVEPPRTGHVCSVRWTIGTAGGNQKKKKQKVKNELSWEMSVFLNKSQQRQFDI